MRLLQVACKRAGEVTQGSAHVAVLRGKGVLAGTRSRTTPSRPPFCLHNTLRKLQVAERVYAVRQHPGLGIPGSGLPQGSASPSTLDPSRSRVEPHQDQACLIGQRRTVIGIELR